MAAMKTYEPGEMLTTFNVMFWNFLTEKKKAQFSRGETIS